jgi:hypothetical protein
LLELGLKIFFFTNFRVHILTIVFLNIDTWIQVYYRKMYFLDKKLRYRKTKTKKIVHENHLMHLKKTIKDKKSLSLSIEFSICFKDHVCGLFDLYLFILCFLGVA